MSSMTRTHPYPCHMYEITEYIWPYLQGMEHRLEGVERLYIEDIIIEYNII